MDRKDFFKRAAQACVVCGGTMLLRGQETPSQPEQSEKERKAREFEKRFNEAYILALMENMEKHLDEKTRVKLMEECGRACARRSGILKFAETYKGEVRKFVETMAEKLGKENVSIEGDTVRWGYPRCFCELVAEGPARLPNVYCNCSVGWVLEVFESIVGKPVKVELYQSVKRGAPACRFQVHL